MKRSDVLPPRHCPNCPTRITIKSTLRYLSRALPSAETAPGRVATAATATAAGWRKMTIPRSSAST